MSQSIIWTTGYAERLSDCDLRWDVAAYRIARIACTVR